MENIRGDALRVNTRHRKFVSIDNIVLEQYLTKISPTSFSLYCLLKKFADFTTGECYPRIDTLAVLLGAGRRTIDRCLSELCGVKLLEKESGREKGTANRYTIVDVNPIHDPNLTCGTDYGASPMAQGCDIFDVGGASSVSHPNKEEREPINNNHLTNPPFPEIQNLPVWINQHSWNGFVEMRKKIKKPLTDHAAHLLIHKLAEFHARGIDPNERLDESTMNCWQGVFEPKGNGNGQIGKEERRIASNRENLVNAAQRSYSQNA